MRLSREKMQNNMTVGDNERRERVIENAAFILDYLPSLCSQKLFQSETGVQV